MLDINIVNNIVQIINKNEMLIIDKDLSKKRKAEIVRDLFKIIKDDDIEPYVNFQKYPTNKLLRIFSFNDTLLTLIKLTKENVQINNYKLANIDIIKFYLQKEKGESARLTLMIKLKNEESINITEHFHLDNKNDLIPNYIEHKLYIFYKKLIKFV
jgi:L-rhamnose mutarotase